MYNICIHIIYVYIHAEKCIASVQSRTRTENKKREGWSRMTIPVFAGNAVV